ncbi:MAG: hypothetical protein R6V04_06040 [bacterium]
MKKYITNILIFFLLFYIGTADAQLKLCIKPWISYSSIQPQDLNNVINSTNYLHSQMESTIPGYNYEGKLNKIGSGIDYGGEIILILNNSFEIGLGFDMIKRGNKTSIQNEYNGTYVEKFRQEISTLPIKLNMYYNLFRPTLNNIMMNFYLTGGLDYHFSNCRLFNETISGTNTDITEESVEKTATDYGLGFHVGIGNEIFLLSNISLFFEVNYMSYKPSDWEGDYRMIQQDPYNFLRIAGPLVYYKEQWGDDLINRINMFFYVPTDSEEYINPRKAVIDFSHFAIKLGMKLSL